MIKREKYLSKIREFYDVDLIKVITGIRRCGKSILLRQIIEEIKSLGVKEKNIIYINFEDVEYSFIKNYLALNKFVKEKIKNEEKYYLFFDEIQNVDMWEKVINSFKATLNVSIFITGSNSKLLSSELSTLLSGRYVSFKIAPFSFSEIVALKNISEKSELEDAFNDYLIWGGMPQRFDFKSLDGTKAYLSDLFDAIVLKILSKDILLKILICFKE